jgi:hypothetical protein
LRFELLLSANLIVFIYANLVCSFSVDFFGANILIVRFLLLDSMLCHRICFLFHFNMQMKHRIIMKYHSYQKRLSYYCRTIVSTISLQLCCGCQT